MFWNGKSKIFSILFAGFVHIFFDKTALLLQGSAQIACLVHAALLSFSNAYKWWLVQRGHKLAAFLRVVYAKEKQVGDNRLAGRK